MRADRLVATLLFLQQRGRATAREVEAAVPGGRSRVRVAAPTALDLARDLAGWGAAVDVLDPPEVRAHLARLGRGLAERYAEGG